MVTWAMRWHANEHELAFPGVLGMPTPASAVDDLTYMETVLPAVSVYVVWWILHTAWLLLHGRHHGHGSAGTKRAGSCHDTVYHLTMRTTPGFAKFVGFKAEESSGLFPALKYMCSHAVACLFTVLIAPVFWRYFWAHTAFVCSLLVCSCWNGACKYYGMMTSSYERRLRALLPEGREPKLERGRNGVSGSGDSSRNVGAGEGEIAPDGSGARLEKDAKRD